MTEAEARKTLARLEERGTYAIAVANNQGVWSVFVGGTLYEVKT